MTYTTQLPSPLGRITLASDGESLTGLWIEGQKYHGDGVPGPLVEAAGLPVFEAAQDWLGRYFAGERPDVAELPLDPQGTAFRLAVWDALRGIPYGETRTYGEVAGVAAARLGRMGSYGRATGAAIGQNPISIVIPCHRVVGADGSLTGYAGGIGTKVKLLELEGVDLSRMYVPTRGTAL